MVFHETSIIPDRTGLSAHLLAIQKPGCIYGKIGYGQIGTGPFDGSQDFHHHPLLINPSVSRRRLDHGIFAAHIVGRSRHTEALFYRADNIQISQRRLYHHDVGAFIHIQVNLTQSLTHIGGIHLMSAAIAELRG